MDKTETYPLTVVLNSGIKIDKDDVVAHGWEATVLAIKDADDEITEIPRENVLYSHKKILPEKTD